MVLAGGGARGAYEVGVLSYLFQEMPEALVAPGRIRLYCGTSVGAVHAAYLAATAHHTRGRVEELQRFWRSLRIESLLRWRWRQVLQLPVDLWNQWHHRGPGRGLLLDSTVLQQLVVRSIPWLSVRRNIRRGLVDALTVTASHVASGRTEVFVDRKSGELPPWTRDARRVPRACRIGPGHVLASAAMPFLFPAVRLHGGYYVDGGLRQNTPLSPALRLGADRALVVSLSTPMREEPGPLESLSRDDPYPDPVMIGGRILDALLLDHVDYDLERLEGINSILSDGATAFGDAFVTKLGDTAERIRGARYRSVATTVVRPSIDLGVMSVQYLEDNHRRFRRLLRWMLRTASSSSLLGTSDLLSFVLFDGGYAERLMQLGREDAHSQREALMAFLSD